MGMDVTLFKALQDPNEFAPEEIKSLVCALIQNLARTTALIGDGVNRPLHSQRKQHSVNIKAIKALSDLL